MSAAWEQPPTDPSHPPDFGHDKDPYTRPPKVPLIDKPIDDLRKMRVVIIGAGFSGITAAIRLPQRMKNVDFVMYEKNPEVGGTWYENHYPGLACDIPAHCYQLTFEPNTHWSAFYAPGPEIRQYIDTVAEKYKLKQYMKFSHTITKAEWSESTGKWTLTITKPDGQTMTDTADAVLSCAGNLNKWKYPNIEGLKDYKGKMTHTAHWQLEPAGDAWKGRRVAVIGCGSSAIQVVPALQPYVTHLDNYVRGSTWIAAPFVDSELEKYTGAAKGNHVFSEEEKLGFEKDPEAYAAFRLRLEDELNAVHGATLKDSEMQNGAKAAFKEMMLRKLEPKPYIADRIIPQFPVACRRLTPGPGYLEALVEKNVDFIPTEIKRLTATGIETTDGQHREYDAIVMATGFDTTLVPGYPIIGRDGVNLQDVWKSYPSTYLTVCQSETPNWYQTLGPNSAIGSGSLLVIIEKEIEYAIKCIKKMQREGIKAMAPKKEAVEAFMDYLDAYFPQTVYSEKCRSWYKGGKETGRISGLWPGSCLHAVFAFEHPRYEDFDYVRLDDHKSIVSWLGNGWTTMEYERKIGHRAFYLDDVDYPPVPE